MRHYQHPQALVDAGARIGDNTRIWAYAHVLPGAVIGADCNICDHVFIENDVVVGDRVTIKCGVQLWDGLRVEDDVFIGPNATFTNDPFPRSKQYPASFPQTRLCRGASIGANATILPGLSIGQNAMIGAGAVVTRTVPPNAIVVGNPGIIVGYVGVEEYAVSAPEAGSTTALQTGESVALGVGGARLHRLPVIEDMRGSLSVGEVGKHLPFLPQRYFTVFDVPSREVRGEHAHKTLQEFLVCVKGSMTLLIDDGKNRVEVVLDSPEYGVHIRPGVWIVQYRYSPDAILLVLASAPYDPDDYLRDYQQFVTYFSEHPVTYDD